MGGPIDKSLFYQALAEIEEGMGYLKGNELAWRYLMQAQAAAYGKDGSGPDGTTEHVLRLDADYKFPVLYAEFEVYPSLLFRFLVYS